VLAAVLSLALGLLRAPGTSEAETDATAAIWCAFLAPAIDGDAHPGDVTSGADFTESCNGLTAQEVTNLADALGDQDGSLDVGDLQSVDLDANQITNVNAAATVPSNANSGAVFTATLDEIYIFAFVDADDVVTFDADVGFSVHVNDEAGGYSANTDANTENCIAEDDLDCDSTTPGSDDGDGVVVATIVDATADAGEDVPIHVSQADDPSAESTETLFIVGQPDEVALTASETVLQAADSLGDVDDCVDSADALDPAAGSEPDRLLVEATVTDSDAAELTRTLVTFDSSDDDRAQAGNSTGVSVDLGGSRVVAAAIFCSGVERGAVTVTANITGGENDGAQLTVVGPAAQLALEAAPASVLCDGSQESTITATVEDSDGFSVADGVDVNFSVTSVGIVSPINTVTLDGAANTSFHGISSFTQGVPVIVTADDVQSSILIVCNGFDTDGDGLPNTFEVTYACLNPSLPDSSGDPDVDALTSLAEYGRNTSPCNADTDGDAVGDAPDNCPTVGNQAQVNTDAAVNPPGDALGDACDANDDNDPCSDAQEAGPQPTSGGDRNPLYPWDFYDVTGDQAIDLADTIAILGKFGLVPGAPGYVASFDRYAPDPQKLYRTAAATGGQIGIDVSDAIVNLQSFGHACV
jgi:hypothetical protein